MPTPISANNTIGVKASLGSSFASDAPTADPTAEATTSGVTVRQSSGILSAYVSELVAVPQNEEILFAVAIQIDDAIRAGNNRVARVID